MQQVTSGFDVALGLITAASAIAMPFVLVGAAKWQNRKAEAAAKDVAATAVAAAEQVATKVTDVARESEKKQDTLVEQGKQIHTLVNSQKTELEHTIKMQAKEIKRLLAASRGKPVRRAPRRK